MALAEALHHSSGPPTKKVVERRERREGEVREEHIAPRGQTRPPPGMRPAPLVEVAEPQVVEAARAHSAAGVPSLAPAVLGGGAATVWTLPPSPSSAEPLAAGGGGGEYQHTFRMNDGDELTPEFLAHIST